MKQLRFLLAALMLLVCGMVCHAQKVVVHKKDGTKVEYDASKVKKVKYAKAYYYYAGWELPKSKEELVKNGTVIENYESMTAGTQIRLFDGEVTTETRGQYYLVIPTNVGIYDSEGLSRLEDMFNEISTMDNYKIYQYTLKASRIGGIMLKKI